MRVRWLSAAATALALAGCAGPHVTLEHGVFRAPSLFRVTVPQDGWTVVRASGAELELRHGSNGTGILAHAECGGEPARHDVAVLARRLFVGLRGRDTLENGQATLGG